MMLSIGLALFASLGAGSQQRDPLDAVKAQWRLPLSQWRLYRNESLGITFRYPPDHEVSFEPPPPRSKPTDKGTVLLRPGRWQETEYFAELAGAEYPVLIQVYWLSFETAAVEKSIFGQEGGRWKWLGTAASPPKAVPLLRNRHWRGVHVSSADHYHFKKGGNAGLGAFEQAVLGTAEASAVLHMVPVYSEQVFRRILASVRLLKRSAAPPRSPPGL